MKLLSNKIDILSLFDYIKVNEAAGTIYNDNWENFLSELFGIIRNCYKNKEYTTYITKDKMQQYNLPWPGGKTYDSIVVYIDNKKDLLPSDSLAAWWMALDFAAEKRKRFLDNASKEKVDEYKRKYPNDFKYAAALLVSTRIIHKDTDKDHFISTAIHELTHGFNTQNSSSTGEKYYKTAKTLNKGIAISNELENTNNTAFRVLGLLTYLYTETEQNARISEFAPVAYKSYKTMSKKRKNWGGYSKKTIYDLIEKNSDILQLNAMQSIYLELNYQTKEFYNYRAFVKGNELLKNNNKIDISDLEDYTEIVLAFIYLYIKQGTIPKPYKLNKGLLRELHEKPSKKTYDKIYNSIVEQTKEINDKFYWRAVKVANHVIMKILDKQNKLKELNVGDIDDINIETVSDDEIFKAIDTSKIGHTK